MKLPETKYLMAAAVVVLVLLVYFLYRRKRNESATGKKPKRVAKKTKKKTRKSSKTRPTKDQEDQDDEPDNEPDEDDESQDSAQELYNLVHDRMASGMQSDEFLEVAGDGVDNLTYIEIKQLYNDARNKSQDPSQSVSIKDYANVLNKRSESE